MYLCVSEFCIESKDMLVLIQFGKCLILIFGLEFILDNFLSDNEKAATYLIQE